MKPCRAPYVLWLIITIAGGTALLSGCGQFGDLYMPEPEPEKQQQDS